MTEIKFGLVCNICRATVSPEKTLDHLVRKHGRTEDYLRGQNINAYYTVVSVLDDWPEEKQTKKKKR